ncbi:hypothetical protein BRADI_2g04624v3 [Brachypodium distachyon]|uniref:DUF4283 domain-containing protein n=1 Tax=Brachypodium distachyon TaxID=15368 RepID=A0A0Q3FUF6_BRADI|nr:hypothetical protein BRADI_2g04624v3 [Brachypodium distachyon]
MLKKLKLHDAELQDVVLGKDDVGDLPSVKWMAVAKVLTGKSFGKGALQVTTQSAWGVDREVLLRELEPNLFLLQAFCLGDWKRIMEDAGVWFREHADEDLQFGEWMLADEALWRPGTPGMRGGSSSGGQEHGRGGRGAHSQGGRFDGRGRGRGRGEERVHRRWKPRQPTNSGGRNRSSMNAGLNDAEELADTATSPIKSLASQKLADQGGSEAKKHLDMDATSQEQGDERVPPPPPQYIPPREQKKMKKSTGVEGKQKGETSSSSNAGSAASPAEDRREQ